MNGNAHLAISNDGRAGLRRRSAAGPLDRMLLMAAAVALLLTAASWLARSSWLLELLTHFRLQFASGGLLILVFSLLRRRTAPAILAGLVVGVNGAFLVPYGVPASAAAEAAQPHIRLMAANVHYRSADYASLREAIRREGPDVVGLLEVTEKWAQELLPLHAEYPFSIVQEEEGAFGLALFSRVPLKESGAGAFVLEDESQTAIIAELSLQGTPVTLILSHFRAPTGPAEARLRNEQLLWLAETVKADANDEQIVLGDLNTTPWSPYYRVMAADAGMTNAAWGRGYIPTWPTWLPTALLRIPIDHCLLSDGLGVQQFRAGPDIGSDHLPIVADIALAGTAAGDSI